jgi:hypothetical protein
MKMKIISLLVIMLFLGMTLSTTASAYRVKVTVKNQKGVPIPYAKVRFSESYAARFLIPFSIAARQVDENGVIYSYSDYEHNSLVIIDVKAAHHTSDMYELRILGSGWVDPIKWDVTLTRLEGRSLNKGFSFLSNICTPLLSRLFNL